MDKFQTGGPDGDLGSNEIKISKDRTTCTPAPQSEKE
jgi:NAD-specific glutamate dehydrogenase